MLKLSFRQQVLTGFAIAIILVFVVGIFSYTSIRQLQSDQEKVNHSQQIIKSSRQVLQYLIDAETGARGYFATGESEFLEPFHTSEANIAPVLAGLKTLSQNDEVSSKNIDSLVQSATERLNIIRDNITDRKEKGLQYLVDNKLMQNGKKSMDHIRKLIAAIDEMESKILTARKTRTEEAATFTIMTIVGGSSIFLVIIIVLFLYIQKTFDQQKKIEAEIKDANGQLEIILGENEAKNWLLTGAGLLNEKMQGQQKEQELADNVLAEVSNYTKAISATFYLFNEDRDELELCSYYAFHDLSKIKKNIKLSESWLGQVAKDQKAATIKGSLNQKLELETSIISQELSEVFIVPVFFDKKLMGVMELAYQNGLNDSIRDYVLLVAKDIGVALHTAQARTIMQNLFEETQQQAEELEAQQEEMRVTNEELLSKTEMLQASEEELKVQQEELRTINAELEEKASLMEEKNQAIEEARLDISRKVEELETTGRYKSEFLANMSHELRTPLNSILVLARILKDNKADNLSTEQIKYASVIFNAGNDLLTLINDILDLAKIESGKFELQNERIAVEEIVDDMEMLFAETASNKRINFSKKITTAPSHILVDKVRVEQVIKNLLSNAFKFTPEEGQISVTASAGKTPGTISFSVKDSGIGIPADKQKLIFEAFQQADGSTSRKYGGTGLGLSISRELANLLGGNLSLISEPGKGSEFILTIPVTAAEQVAKQEETVPTVESFEPAEVQMPVLARPQNIDPNRPPTVVIVEDDKNFADILENYAKDHGYNAILVNEGTNAVQIIADNMPDAVILDIMLPGKDGWQILKELKQVSDLKDIPVHLMSAGEAAEKKVKSEGAISFMKKPIKAEAIDKLFGDIIKQSGSQIKQILLVEDHQAQSDALKELMQKQGITVQQAFDGESAFEMLQQDEYQCVILDLNLPDISGLDLLDKIKAVDKFASLPIIVNTAMELDKNSVSRLMQYANAMVVKTNKSSDRLIDEVNLFLHKLNSASPVAPVANPMVKKGGGLSKESLKGKKVLLVDDDMRNIFALSSALQTYDLVVEIANDGEEALQKLDEIDGIDIVLMDIMMPKMDGYEATREIRKNIKWSKLPVIALTAKAMKDDRDKCIAAGANDYITKPVDIDRLISLMQLWIVS
ncbi:response regulator [Mucilaginibacter ginkgonis]|uniref:histidine kinase n=1 Tax=Mucilaginibacter ginkgonis TaxID=2682091 RepID=A0A6I4I5F4_9SPHI|nr:response regulator [Mucilaginibacter ginkgonis]QQL48406.1 response regulator [Mucilaginibacter ginkgonis]